MKIHMNIKENAFMEERYSNSSVNTKWYMEMWIYQKWLDKKNNVSGWKEHHSHSHNNKSQTISKIITFFGTPKKAEVTGKPVTSLKLKRRQAPQRERWKGLLQSACAKVLELFCILIMAKIMWLYELVKSHETIC